MNYARIARLFRELADEFDDGETVRPRDAPSSKPAKGARKHQTRAPYRPPLPSDIDVAAVKRMARKAGIHLP